MNKTATLIRLAARAEIPLLAAIQLAAATRFPEDALPEPMRSTYTVPEEIMIEAVEKERLWAARSDDGRLLGYAVWRDLDGAAILEQVDVPPERGRRGIGALLVNHILAQAAGAGYHRLYLTTFEALPWNAPFYLKLGFTVAADENLPPPLLEIIRRERDFIKGRISMERDLSDSLPSVNNATNP